MQALFFIATLLAVYFLLGIFFPRTMLFFLPARKRYRSIAIWLTIIFIGAAIVFVSASPAAQVSGI